LLSLRVAKSPPMILTVFAFSLFPSSSINSER
jgi:hypothetical protein